MSAKTNYRLRQSIAISMIAFWIITGTISAADSSNDAVIRASLKDEQLLAAALERLFGEVKELKNSKVRAWQEFEILARRINALEGSRHEEVYSLLKRAMETKIGNDDAVLHYRRFQAQLKLLETEHDQLNVKVDVLESRVTNLEKRLSLTDGKVTPTIQVNDRANPGKKAVQQALLNVAVVYHLSSGMVQITKQATSCCVLEGKCVEVYVGTAGPYHGDLFVNCEGGFVLVQHPRGSRK